MQDDISLWNTHSNTHSLKYTQNKREIPLFVFHILGFPNETIVEFFIERSIRFEGEKVDCTWILCDSVDKPAKKNERKERDSQVDKWNKKNWFFSDEL